MTDTMLDQFKAARRVSVPILVIRTADQANVVEALRTASEKHPVVQWDAARGITPICTDPATPDPGRVMLEKLIKQKVQVDPDETIGLLSALTVAREFPRLAILCIHNAHRQLISSEPVGVAHNVQAVANLRDEYKRDFRMLILLCPHFVPPPELAHDVIVIDDPLPTPDALHEIVTDLHASAELTVPGEEDMERAVTAVSGLSQFEAEQVTAMSLTEDGLEYDRLWERKRITIEQTRGLRVHRGQEVFDDLVGITPLKAKLRNRGQAKTPVGVVVFMDEIDKVLANVEEDTTGVRMDQLRTLLTEMEDNEWRGLVCVGVAGGGKSAIAKAFGNELQVPTVSLDLGDMEAPHVGESEALIRHAMAVIKAIGRGHAYFIATSNNASVMRPEMQRRFTDGFWFFDLMTPEQRTQTWQLYMQKYELDAQDLPSDEGWTGAEIRNCCREAWDTGLTIKEAAQFIVPMAQSRAGEIDKLQRYANGRFLDANNAGVYKYADTKTNKALKRAIELTPQVMSQEMGES